MALNTEAFRDAQSMARIAYFSDDKGIRETFWAGAMKSLKEAYGVK